MQSIHAIYKYNTKMKNRQSKDKCGKKLKEQINTEKKEKKE